MCNSSVNKPVRLPLSKTEEAGKRIAAGQGLGLVTRVSRMPALNQGRHGAAEVVAGYRRQAVEDIQNMQARIYAMFVGAQNDHDNPGELSDIELNEISLTCEVVVNSIQKYLRIKAAD